MDKNLIIGYCRVSSNKQKDDLGIKDLDICSNKEESYKNINKSQKVKKLEKNYVDCNVRCLINTNQIKKEEVTLKQAIL